ncbi:hypothetical protein [Sphingobium chungangianum]
MALFKGKYLKLFILTDAAVAPYSDEDYIMVGTENEITISLKSDNETYNTKTYGNIVDAGPRQMTIKGTAETVVENDAGHEALVKADGKTVRFQVRDVSGRLEANITAASDPLDKIYIDSEFLVSETEEKASATGLVEYTFTLESSGIIQRNRPARAFVPAT